VLLHTVFERVAIAKPVTSRPASAERFLVCMGLLVAGDSLLPVLNRLRAVCDVLRTHQQQQQQQQQQRHQQQYYADSGSSSSQWQECTGAETVDAHSTDTTGDDRVAAEAAELATAAAVPAVAATEAAAAIAASAQAAAAVLSSDSSDESMQELCLIDAQLFAQTDTDRTSTTDSSSTAVGNVVQYLRAVNDALLQLQVAACSAILTEADSGRFHDHESSIEYAVRHKRERTLQAACVQAWRLQ
jgi:FtsJ-like methyltransferase